MTGFSTPSTYLINMCDKFWYKLHTKVVRRNQLHEYLSNICHSQNKSRNDKYLPNCDYVDKLRCPKGEHTKHLSNIRYLLNMAYVHPALLKCMLSNN